MGIINKSRNQRTMGNVQVKYKAMRGSHEDGDPIEEPRDWFEALLISQREDYTEGMLATLTEAQKAELNNCFDDGNADVFRNVGSANGWLGEADDEELAETKTVVEAKIE